MKKIFEHPNHRKPITRRELLAAGAIDLFTYALVPNALSLLVTNRALAECAPNTGRPAELPPFLVFDCAGGAALSGNFLVGKSGGSLDFLSSYNKMGIAVNPSGGVEPIDTQFGLPMLTNLSQIRAGLVAQTTTTNLRMVSICAASTDDTGANLLSPIGLICRTGYVGLHVQRPVGTRNTSTGGNSTGPLVLPAMKPVVVNDANSLPNALSYGSGLSSLTVSQRDAIARGILRLSQSQRARLSSMSLGDQFATLAECGYLKNAEYTNSASLSSQVDPRQNAEVQAVYGITPQSNGGVTRSASVVFNVLQGTTGPGVITIGGCDYHDGTQTTGDTKDLEIGTEIGRAIELARRLNKPLFFVVISDGSVYSDDDTRVWRGDAGSMGLVVMGYFHPSSTPSTLKTQVGHYRDGQGVERSTYVGNSAKRAAYVTLLNYLALAGKAGEFQNIVSQSEFDPGQINSHIAFG